MTIAVGAFLLRWLRRAVNLVAGLLFIYMCFAILAQILGRYIFNYSIAGTEETATYAQIWLVLLGAGIAMRNGQHVAIDILIVRCPPLVQRIAKTASLALGLWFLAVVFIGSFGLLSIGMIVKSPALRIPLAYPYSALPVGIAYFMLEFAIATVPDIVRGRIAAHIRPAELETGAAL
ncbi:TRAP transporter small permease [Acuticoccus sp. I52.16.1]|uniref:TRAP transporter small permease n=1 Tax=Acuticoccus sp. I52.16.1 TaxID=2928472 RepID=UPI001FD0D8C2|nr:TRAP transporter small permease [Acuticoccus sp. I52.16.1]UOM35372.1 TRAP transporter small permease [Acuticoccus sp. I52.16.1]